MKRATPAADVPERLGRMDDPIRDGRYAYPRREPSYLEESLARVRGAGRARGLPLASSPPEVLPMIARLLAQVRPREHTGGMPELPEVHALANDLAHRLTGRTIESLDIVSFAALKTFDPSATALAGQTITGVGRWGKFLDISVGDTGDLHLVMHLARAGWVRWRETVAKESARPSKGPLAARLVLVPTDDATRVPGVGLDITEAGSKKSLAIYVVTDPQLVPGIARLGPDPLSPGFTERVFRDILHGAGRAQIKGILRNQSVIAGIGNAYSDEILHAAKMSPFKPASMTDADIAVLYDALQVTLRGAVDRADGLAASELKGEKKSGMQVHGRAGQACPVCGDTVREVIFADSTLQYCPTCQTGGKPLADRVLSRLLK